MARTNDPNSAKDQFFLMRDESAFLNRQYTSWGRMLKGLDVARALTIGEPPPRPDILVSATMAADLSPATRPNAWVMRTDSDAFQAFLNTQDRSKSICDLPQVPAVLDTKD
jgi:peptidylprolyl isomerase